MILITSAAFVDQELSSEFGMLPPAFLPVGNRRLYRHQAAVLPLDERKVLSIPESFEVPPQDRAWLESAGIELLEIPAGLSRSRHIELTGVEGGLGVVGQRHHVVRLCLEELV